MLSNKLSTRVGSAFQSTVDTFVPVLVQHLDKGFANLAKILLDFTAVDPVREEASIATMTDLTLDFETRVRHAKVLPGHPLKQLQYVDDLIPSLVKLKERMAIYQPSRGASSAQFVASAAELHLRINKAYEIALHHRECLRVALDPAAEYMGRERAWEDLQGHSSSPGWRCFPSSPFGCGV